MNSAPSSPRVCPGAERGARRLVMRAEAIALLRCPVVLRRQLRVVLDEGVDKLLAFGL